MEHEAFELATYDAAVHAHRCGQLLNKWKKLVPPDQWTETLEQHCSRLKLRTAQIWMRIARECPTMESGTSNRQIFKAIEQPKVIEYNGSTKTQAQHAASQGDALSTAQARRDDSLAARKRGEPVEAKAPPAEDVDSDEPDLTFDSDAQEAIDWIAQHGKAYAKAVLRGLSQAIRDLEREDDEAETKQASRDYFHSSKASRAQQPGESLGAWQKRVREMH